MHPFCTHVSFCLLLFFIENALSDSIYGRLYLLLNVSHDTRYLHHRTQLSLDGRSCVLCRYRKRSFPVRRSSNDVIYIINVPMSEYLVSTCSIWQQCTNNYSCILMKNYWGLLIEIRSLLDFTLFHISIRYRAYGTAGQN